MRSRLSGIGGRFIRWGATGCGILVGLVALAAAVACDNRTPELEARVSDLRSALRTEVAANADLESERDAALADLQAAQDANAALKAERDAALADAEKVNAGFETGETATPDDDSSASSSQAGGASDLGVHYSADELMAAYLGDADAYKADWVNHRINVTGTVKEVSRAGEVYLSTSYEGEEVILAGLTDALTNDVIEGDSVTFACVIGDYYRGAIDMTDCRPAEHGNEQGRDGASDLGAPYSADELMAAYLDDADAYDSDWVNHRINVAGTVKEIIRAEIYLSTSFGDDVVILSGLADETLDGIAAGGIVEFACVIGGYSRGGIDMTDCGPAEHGNEQGSGGAGE